MIYTLVTVLVAFGLMIVFNLSFWLVLAIIGIGAGLSYLKSKGNTHTGAIAIIMAIVIVGTVASNFVNSRLRLTSKLSDHSWLGYDLKIATEATQPAIKAKAAMFSLQTNAEDEGAKKVENLYKAGKTKEALTELQRLTMEGEEIRAAIAPAPFVPTSNLGAKHTSKTGKVDYYKVISLIRTARDIQIKCNYNYTLTGTRNSNGSYEGQWTQGGIHGPFNNLRFSTANNAEGIVGVMEGDIPLIIFPQ